MISTHTHNGRENKIDAGFTGPFGIQLLDATDGAIQWFFKFIKIISKYLKLYPFL